jgi:hypothetical protein
MTILAGLQFKEIRRDRVAVRIGVPEVDGSPFDGLSRVSIGYDENELRVAMTYALPDLTRT